MMIHKLLLATASQMRLRDNIGITREDTSQHFTPRSHSDLIVAALLLFPFSELRSPSRSELCVTFLFFCITDLTNGREGLESGLVALY